MDWAGWLDRSLFVAGLMLGTSIGGLVMRFLWIQRDHGADIERVRRDIADLRHDVEARINVLAESLAKGAGVDHVELLKEMNRRAGENHG